MYTGKNSIDKHDHIQKAGAENIPRCNAPALAEDRRSNSKHVIKFANFNTFLKFKL